MRTFRRSLLWAGLLLAACGAGNFAFAQSVTSPAITRADTLASAAVKLTYPALFDSSRVKFTACLQTRKAGVNSAQKCSTKTGPWLKRVVVAPPPPPPPPPVIVGIPGTPVLTVGTDRGTSADINVGWTVATNATSYRFTSSAGNGTVTGTGATLAAQARGAAIWFCVWGRNGTKESADSACNSFTVPPPLTAPLVRLTIDTLGRP